MDRKEFLKTCGFACAGGSVLALVQGCAGMHYYAQATVENDQIIIQKSEFEYIKKEETVRRPYVLVMSEKFSPPICVYNINEENYSALLLQCTHRGCELQPQADYLVCPCHGSEFTNEGIVQNPPAEKNLQTFKTSIDRENIYIHL